jgi:hypothetical protein
VVLSKFVRSFGWKLEGDDHQQPPDAAYLLPN